MNRLANTRSPVEQQYPSQPLPDRPASLLRRLVMEATITGARTIHVEPSEDGWQVRLRRASGLTSRRIGYGSDLGPRLARVYRCAPDLTVPGGHHRIKISIEEIGTFDGASWIIRTRAIPRVVPTLDDIVGDHVTRHRLRQVLDQPSGLVVLSGDNAASTALLRAAIAQYCVAPDRRVLRLEESPECHPPGSIGCLMTPELRDNPLRVADLDADVIVIGDIKVDPVGISRLARHTSDTSLVVLSFEADDIETTLARLKELDADHHWAAHRAIAVIRHDELALLCTSCREPVNKTQPMVEDQVSDWLQSMMYPTKEAHGCDACHHSGIGGTVDIIDVLTLNDALREELRQDQRSAVCQQLEYQRLAPSSLARSVRAGLIDQREAERIGKRAPEA